MTVTLYDLAQRFVGDVREISGDPADPAIVWFLRSCLPGASSDEIPWCSGFLNRLAWLLRLPRSKSLAARSWLTVGTPVPLEQATAGFDVVIFRRGDGPGAAGPEVLAAPGHVALFSGREGDQILALGGNQGNAVSVGRFPVSGLLGVRRLV